MAEAQRGSVSCPKAEQDSRAHREALVRSKAQLPTETQKGTTLHLSFPFSNEILMGRSTEACRDSKAQGEVTRDSVVSLSQSEQSTKEPMNQTTDIFNPLFITFSLNEVYSPHIDPILILQ